MDEQKKHMNHDGRSSRRATTDKSYNENWLNEKEESESNNTDGAKTDRTEEW